MDFSETIEACDLKVGGCRQLIELMKLWKVKVISWPWPQDIYVWKPKLVLLRNYWAIFNQTLYISFQVQGNESPWKNMMLVTWPRWLPYPYMVKTLQKSSSPESVDKFPSNLYVASVTPAHYSLYKWWPWVDLDLFNGKVKFGNLGFSIGKLKTVDFF